MAHQSWYGVRSIFRSDRAEDGKPCRTFEERVVLFQAASFEDALAKGEADSEHYAADWPHPKVLDHVVAFHIHDEELREGDEVWSCIRGLVITDEEFIRRFYEGEYTSLPNVSHERRECQGAASSRRPAGQSDGLDNVLAASDRAFPAAIAGVTHHTSHSMSAHPEPDKVREFLDAFEEVFDKDWVHTKQQLGVQEDTKEQRRACAEAGLESIPFIADDGTFVHPRVEDEVNDWGNRARLLQAYRALRKDLP